jgi:hypothetical protein
MKALRRAEHRRGTGEDPRAMVVEGIGERNDFLAEIHGKP